MACRRSVLLLLLFVPLVPAQSGLEVVLHEHAFSYGPETWKGGDFERVDDAESFTLAATDWNASLGLRLDMRLGIRPVGGVAGEDWQFEVTLTDGTTTLMGEVDPRGAGNVDVRFDVDGQRALPGSPAIAPLTPGEWRIEARAYVSSPQSGEIPRGSGSTFLAAQGLQPHRLSLEDETVDWMPMPEDAMPYIQEAGPGPALWVNRVPLTPGSLIGLEVDAGVGGRTIEWDMWQADGALPDFGDPTSGTPLDIFAPPQPGGVTWARDDLATADGQVVDPDGIALFYLRIPPEAPDGVRIVVATDPDEGGAAVFAITVAAAQPRFTDIISPAPGQEGNVQVEMLLAAGEPPLQPVGELFALGIAPEGTLAAPILARADLLGRGDDTYRGDLDGRILRAQAESRYEMLAVYRDSEGDYAGHAFHSRGVDVEIEIPPLGVGHQDEIVVRLIQQDPQSSVGLTGKLRFTFTDVVVDADFEIGPGGLLEKSYPVTPSKAGATPLSVTIDTGDLHHEIDRSAIVLDGDLYEQEKAEWYDPGKYVPGPGWALLLAGLAIVARRKR